MRINNEKVSAARKVLTIINRKTIPKGENHLSLNHYPNCREQGFMVMNYKTTGTKCVAFSENRNSDYIVVYPSVEGVTDESWNVRTLFPYNRPEKAADYCIRHLLS
jgi:hypothetical protein